MSKFRVIIAGSRDFDDYELLKKKCDALLTNVKCRGIIIVCGGARGADKLGAQYADERGFEVEYHYAQWDKYGKRAGYMRNEIMAKRADSLIAFWDKKSRGTKHMIDLANKYKLPTRIINF